MFKAVAFIGVAALFAALIGLVYLGFVGIAWLFFWCTEALNMYTFTGSIWVAGLLLMIVVTVLHSAFSNSK